MHELAIAESLVDVATEEAARLGAVRVEALRLRLGPLSGVVKEALLFSFAAMAEGTPIEGARLDIEEVPATVWCGVCSAERVLTTIARRRCPTCGALTPELLAGDELELVGLEIAGA